MDRSRLNIAKIGESLALKHLKARGCKILAQNYRARRGEIDLIVQDGEFTVFVEVKTRRSLRFGLPQAAVTLAETATNLQGCFGISASPKPLRRALPF